MLRLVFVLLSCFVGALIASHPDEIKDLPGLDIPINFKHYSGYLNATRGRYLHYWFVESQRSPSTDPVVLWLNGGPGCSSLDGFLSELGPLHVSADGKSLYKNPYSWNRIANVIFLEAPAGVGFSYADNKKYSTDDDSVSYDNYVALQSFFEKFPEFKKNDFYITGESYGGIYIPTLSVRVLTGPANINFKGFAVGNGYLDVRNLTNSIVFFAYYHGLIGNKLWGSLSKFCCGGLGAIEMCNFADSASVECQDAVSEVSNVVQGSGLNVYNLYSDCAQSQERNSRDLVDKRNILHYLPKPTKGFRYSDDPPCIDSSNVKKWINQPSVRQALHIPTHVQDWDICSLDVEIGYKRLYDTMRPQVLQLIGSGKLRGLIYNGDVDMACNFLGDEWFANDLGLQVTEEYGLWKFNNQVAGFFKSYGPLTFLTVKGSGHMVPQDKPGPAFKMIDSFLSNSPYN
ncbi:lysosomal protective protein-like [Argiope bruennichi]|uniref:lysosomal protective protein-like n=1 Tax=Argiope bruennichi TaxID=94029 RepID=UPI002494D5EB|nr:lysosomal protective protein-like [Argiope bruennichi]